MLNSTLTLSRETANPGGGGRIPAAADRFFRPIRSLKPSWGLSQPAARAAIEKALVLPGGGRAFDTYLLSMIYDRQGRHDLARHSMAAALEWEKGATRLRISDLRDLEMLRKEAEEAAR